MFTINGNPLLVLASNGTSIFNNLNSPGERDRVGAVAQEKRDNKTPAMRTIIVINLIGINLLIKTLDLELIQREQQLTEKFGQKWLSCFKFLSLFTSPQISPFPVEETTTGRAGRVLTKRQKISGLE